MNDYRLIMIEVNTYRQEQTTQIIGNANTPSEFLNRCWDALEKEIEDEGLLIEIDAPEDYGYAGGFAPAGRPTLYENGINIQAEELDWW